MRRKSFINAAILCAFSAFLISCSPQRAGIPASASTPTTLPASQPVATVTQPAALTPAASPTSLLGPAASMVAATRELVRRISGDPNPFNMPANLAFDTMGDMYVLDAGNERVQLFDPSGKFLLKWGSYGLGDGQFLRPLDLAVDAQGNIYVVDDHREDIQKFDPQGKFLRKFGGVGQGDGQLSNTGGITIGPDGNLYIADYGNNRVEVFSPDGKYLRQWPTPVEKVVDIAVDSKGNIFTTHESGEMVEYDPSGKPISIMDKLGLDGGGGIVINSDGLLYVTDNQGIEVLREK